MKEVLGESFEIAMSQFILGCACWESNYDIPLSKEYIVSIWEMRIIWKKMHLLCKPLTGITCWHEDGER